MSTAAKVNTAPRASRPYAPNYGIKKENEGAGLLPWSWAEERLEKTQNFFISTVTPDHAPHVMVIWGMWFEGKFFFSTGANSRKAKNLAANPRCVITTGNSDEAVILEGRVSPVNDRALRSRYTEAVTKKYKFDLGPYSEEPIYALEPQRAFALVEKDFVGSATRWTWE